MGRVFENKSPSMDLPRVCDVIALPDEVTATVLALHDLPEIALAQQHNGKLRDRASWGEAFAAVKSTLGDDPDGMRMLTFMLMRAGEVHSEYMARGISDEIFAETMKFCTRFLIEHHATFGTYAFVWGWWFPRQLALQEFRIGTLEYELIEAEGVRTISVHIPGDATLTLDALRQSYREARETLARIAPDFADAAMYCDSWMLSPVLDDLLSPGSNILLFKSSFDIISVDAASPHAIRWIYGRSDLPVEQLPERTSLQRATKALLQKGGTVGAGMGKLRDDPWVMHKP